MGKASKAGALSARASGVRLAIAVMVAAALCGACSASPGGGTGKAGRELVWGKPAEVTELDPTIAGGAESLDILYLVYEGLVGLDDDLKPVPALADSWQRPSPTTYVFHLRKGARFSNGREVTVDDVTGSLKRLIDPKRAAYWTVQLGIKDVEPSGDAQIKITLLRPKTSFLAALAGSPAAVLPMRELNAKSFDPDKQLLGTGPYKVVAHSQNESWTLQRNPYYWNAGSLKNDTVMVRIMPDNAARAAALRDGGIDVTTFENPDSLLLLKGQANVRTAVEPTTDYYRLDVNAKSSIFRDDRLRQALALSIDRDRIRSVALAGVGRPTAAVSVAFGDVCDPAAVPFARPDVARARQLVTAAGATGETVRILAPSSIGMASPIAQVLQRNLQAAGLKVSIQAIDNGELNARAYTGKKADFDVIVTWYAGLAEASMVLPWWNPDLAHFNKPYLKADPGLDKAIDAGLTTPPGQKRTTAMREACARIAQDANVIPLLSKDAIVAYRADRVSPVLPHKEAYAAPLRRLGLFEPKR